MFTAALFATAKNWKSKCLWYICTIDYYLAMKRDELLIHLVIWINPKVATLSKLRQQKYMWYVSVSKNFTKCKLNHRDRRPVSCRDKGGGG